MTMPYGRCALINEYSIVVNIVIHNGDELPPEFSNCFLFPIENVFCGTGFLFDPETETFIDTREPDPEVVE